MVRETLRHWRQLLRSAEYRRKDQLARREFDAFCREHGGLGLRHRLLPVGPEPKTALMVSLNLPSTAKKEAWATKVLQLAGFDMVILGNRAPELLRYYRLAGVKQAVSWSDVPTEGDAAWIDRVLTHLETLRDWLALQYRGVHVGRFAVATVMRALRQGTLDLTDATVREHLRAGVDTSVRHVLAGLRLIEEIRPDCLIFSDRGYVSQGELFDLGLAHGIDTITCSGAYRSNLVLFKRYNLGNEREHPSCLSATSWKEMCSIPWTPEYGRQVRDELFDSYQTQDWFSSYGVQFGKRILARQATRERLGLPSDRKVAAIFPHILWDGSFFWGDDLFADYTQWFVETMKAACGNPRLHWLVKLHPGHVVKSKRENICGTFSEVIVLEQAIGALPPHVTLVYPDNDISTYSMFEVIDYAVTVRGTVGIEAALFGVPVVTAGTGRYDRRGFTVDSATPGEYLRRLATLETVPRLSPAQVELAERFAYGVFLCRPTRLQSASLEFERDGVASMKMSIHCKTRQDWLDAPDVRQLAAWIADGATEELLAWPAVG